MKSMRNFFNNVINKLDNNKNMNKKNWIKRKFLEKDHVHCSRFFIVSPNIGLDCANVPAI